MSFSQCSLSQRNVRSPICKNCFEFLNLMNEQFGLISVIRRHSAAQLHEGWKRQHPFAKPSTVKCFLLQPHEDIKISLITKQIHRFYVFLCFICDHNRSFDHFKDFTLL